MVRRLRIQRLAAGLALLPFTVMVAASCGGDDFIDAADGGVDGQVLDGSGRDAPAVDGTVTDSNVPDANAPDADAGADVDAATVDADATIPDAADATTPDAANARDAADANDANDARDAADANDAADARDAADANEAGDAGLNILGAASGFAVLGGSSVTTTAAANTVTGDVGVSPGTAIGTWNVPPVGTLRANDGIAAQGHADLQVAFNDLAGRPCIAANNFTGQDLGGKTLAPGVYCFSTSVALTGTLFLDAQNNPNATWVFQVGSTLTVANGGNVIMLNGTASSACNVYWQVGSSATLGTTSSLLGNIVSAIATTLNTGALIPVGRAMSLSGAVNLDGNTISKAACP